MSEVQFNKAELLLCDLFGLDQSQHTRAGTDAHDEFGNPYELKSTTTYNVSTARHADLTSLKKWRKHYWLMFKGKHKSGGYDVKEVAFLHPDMLEPWFVKLEKELLEEDRLIQNLLGKGRKSGDFSADEMALLERICGKGVFRNCPTIPWTFVRENGVILTKNHAPVLRELVQEFPLYAN